MRVKTLRAGESRRARFGCGVALLTAAVVAAIGSIAAAVFFLISPGSGGAVASFIHAQPGVVRWDGHSRLTVLLIGRRSDSPNSPAASLTVGTFDPSTRRVGLLSLPPDLWVNIPGYGPGRLGDALSDAGIREQVLTVESVLRVPVPYYAAIGPQMMSQVTDLLGGVTLRLDAGTTLHGQQLHAGTRHLDGPTALAYASSSGLDPRGSLVSIQRQQSVLFALVEQSFTAQNFFRIPTIINTVGGSIATNFPYDQIVSALHQLARVPRSQMTGDALSYVNGAVTGYDAQNGEVSLPDWQHIRHLAQRLMPSSGIRPLGSVSIVNGTGVAGQAVTLADWLRGDGIRIAGYTSGPPAGYVRTRVEVARGAGPRTLSLARTVSLLLQVPVSVSAGNAPSSSVTVRMGRDYQDVTQQ